MRGRAAADGRRSAAALFRVDRFSPIACRVLSSNPENGYSVGMGKAPSTSLEYARKLRRDMTDAERVLWRLLRDRRVEGWRFRRQEPIDRYIVDFICFEARLVIEVDGGPHFESQSDKTRDAYLQSQGFYVLRFWNTEVLSNRDGVYRTITEALARCAPDGAAPSSSSA